jgi:hypothetical protein
MCSGDDIELLTTGPTDNDDYDDNNNNNNNSTFNNNITITIINLVHILFPRQLQL